MVTDTSSHHYYNYNSAVYKVGILGIIQPFAISNDKYSHITLPASYRNITR